MERALQTLLNSAIHFNIYHVFTSTTCFHTYISTDLGVLKLVEWTWVATEYKDASDLITRNWNKPIYSHGCVVDDVTFWKKGTVKSKTPVELKDWEVS